MTNTSVVNRVAGERNAHAFLTFLPSPRPKRQDFAICVWAGIHSHVIRSCVVDCGTAVTLSCLCGAFAAVFLQAPVDTSYLPITFGPAANKKEQEIGEVWGSVEGFLIEYTILQQFTHLCRRMVARAARADSLGPDPWYCKRTPQDKPNIGQPGRHLAINEEVLEIW